MGCQLETVTDPSWWAGTSSVQLTIDGIGTYNVLKANVELLPQGVSIIGIDGAHPTVLAPWHTVSAIRQTG